MPRRRRTTKRRTDGRDVVTRDQLMELLCGPSPRGTAFASAADRGRCRRLLGMTPSPTAVERAARTDQARVGTGASGRDGTNYDEHERTAVEPDVGTHR